MLLCISLAGKQSPAGQGKCQRAEIKIIHEQDTVDQLHGACHLVECTSSQSYSKALKWTRGGCLPSAQPFSSHGSASFAGASPALCSRWTHKRQYTLRTQARHDCSHATPADARWAPRPAAITNPMSDQLSHNLRLELRQHAQDLSAIAQDAPSAALATRGLPVYLQRSAPLGLLTSLRACRAATADSSV